jgi:hypothetical protein
MPNTNSADNPYSPPRTEPKSPVSSRWKRRLKKDLFTLGVFIVLFVGYWGIRIAMALYNQWEFSRHH